MSGTIRLLGKINFIVLFAALVTVSLFYAMQLLIMAEEFIPNDKRSAEIQQVTMPELELVINRPTPKPEEIETPPVIPDINFTEKFDQAPLNNGWQSLNEDIPLDVDTGTFLGPMDGNAMPIAQIQPVYPTNAISRGIEGFVIVEFDVNENGTVINPRVLGAEPPRVFDRAALRAIERWKYNPAIVDGSAVPMRNLRTRFSFNLRE